MEDVKFRDLCDVVGRNNCSRAPKRAARSDGGKRSDCCCQKVAKPRDTGGILDRVSIVVCRRLISKLTHMYCVVLLSNWGWADDAVHLGKCTDWGSMHQSAELSLLLNISTTSVLESLVHHSLRAPTLCLSVFNGFTRCGM